MKLLRRVRTRHRRPVQDHISETPRRRAHEALALGGGEAAGRRGGAAGRGRQNGPADGFGSLSLRVQPADAEVLIDGEPWQGSQGAEPLVVQLGAGTHHVEIRRDGYRTYLTDIPLGSGQVRTLNVSLTKQ